MQPVLGLRQPVLRTAQHHREPVLQIHLEQFLEGQRARLALHQGDGVDREGVLQLGHLVELLQQRLGIDAVFHLDHQS